MRSPRRRRRRRSLRPPSQGARGGGSPARWLGGETASAPVHRGAGTDASEPLETTLRALAASAGPLRRTLAAVAARIVETRAHERLGFARIGDYARERAGISGRQLHDLARVDRALRSLPVIDRALSRNEICWSKVRLVTRVATSDDESAWLARARGSTARALDGAVRRALADGDGPPRPADPAHESADDSPKQRLALRCTAADLRRWHRMRELAAKVAGHRIPECEAFEMVVAEAFAAIGPSVESDGRDPLESPSAPAIGNPTGDLTGANTGADPTGAATGAATGDDSMTAAMPSHDTTVDAEAGTTLDTDTPAVATAMTEAPPFVLAITEGLEQADAFDLDARLARAIRREQRLDAAMAPLLRALGSAHYEWSIAWTPVAAFAREALGLAPSKARALIRLERVGDVCPELREAFRSGRLSWVKAQLLAPLFALEIDGEWRPRWVEWAKRVTVRRLEEDVATACLLRAASPDGWERARSDPASARDVMRDASREDGGRSMCAHDPDAAAALATERLEWRLPVEVAALVRAVMSALRSRWIAKTRRIPTDAEVFGAMLAIAEETWLGREPGARKPDPVFERDHYRCAVPACSSRRNLHDHHIQFRSAGGGDELENRITLCAFHHLRGVHSGIVRVRGLAPDHLRFELGVRDGVAWAVYLSGDVVAPGPRPEPHPSPGAAPMI